MSQTVALLVTFLCVLMIATGQILFKMAATRGAQLTGSGFWESWLTWPFMTALAVYGFATLLWVWTLRHIALNVAYPVFALAFLIVPVLGNYLLGEPLHWRHFAGGALIVAGVALSSQV